MRKVRGNKSTSASSISTQDRLQSFLAPTICTRPDGRPTGRWLPRWNGMGDGDWCSTTSPGIVGRSLPGNERAGLLGVAIQRESYTGVRINSSKLVSVTDALNVSYLSRWK